MSCSAAQALGARHLNFIELSTTSNITELFSITFKMYSRLGNKEWIAILKKKALLYVKIDSEVFLLVLAPNSVNLWPN